MDASLLFRKKAALAEDGLDWLKGSDEFPFTAKRNTTGRAAVSAILVRALLTAVEGHCREAQSWATGVAARVVSKSTPGAAAWCWHDEATYALPHGEANKITYHFGVLWILQALRAPLTAPDFWAAYRALLEATHKHGRAVAIKVALVQAADELYYFGRYADATPDADHDRLTTVTIVDSLNGAPPTGDALDLAPLTDLSALEQLTRHRALPVMTDSALPLTTDGFVGWQLPALREALQNGWNVLLAGPTGTGKSLAVQEAVLADSAALVTIEGKEGLTDLDFLGAILPQADGSRRWVDGPLLRALRQAQFEPVVLFLDEVNRIRREYLNLLLGLMNTKPAGLCLRQGVAVNSQHAQDKFYVIEVPLTSEVVWCPSAHLRIVAAGNFGSDYAVYPLDPAVRRRFDVVLDFDYLPLEQELALLRARYALDRSVAKALCLVAQYTRHMRRNGDLPGCVDTASLLNWAQLCAQYHPATAHAVMRLGLRVWADLACGRDHLGLVRQAKFDGLTDYLLSQSVLPAGDASLTSGGRAHFLPRA